MRFPSAVLNGDGSARADAGFELREYRMQHALALWSGLYVGALSKLPWSLPVISAAGSTLLAGF
jgi:hypothetical protein